MNAGRKTEPRHHRGVGRSEGKKERRKEGAPPSFRQGRSQQFPPHYTKPSQDFVCWRRETLNILYNIIIIIIGNIYVTWIEYGVCVCMYTPYYVYAEWDWSNDEHYFYDEAERQDKTKTKTKTKTPPPPFLRLMTDGWERNNVIPE